MKDLFKKENRISFGMSSEALKERCFYFTLTIVFFALGAFAMWEMVYELCHMIGSISCADPAQTVVELKRMLPFILNGFGFVYIAAWVHHAYTAPSKKARSAAWFRGGIGTIVFGAAIILYIVIGLISGQYEKLVEGYISLLFPLDIMIGGVLFIVVGLLAIKYAKQLKTAPGALPYMSHRHCAFVRTLGRIPCLLAYLVSLASFAGCVYGTYVMDWKHGGIVFNIMLFLNYFTAFAMVAVYRFGYIETKDELKPQTMKKTALWFLIINIVLYALYTVSVQIWNEAPNQNAFGILPVEYTASVNAFAPLYLLMNIGAPLIAFVKGCIRSKKK